MRSKLQISKINPCSKMSKTIAFLLVVCMIFSNVVMLNIVSAEEIAIEEPIINELVDDLTDETSDDADTTEEPAADETNADETAAQEETAAEPTNTDEPAEEEAAQEPAAGETNTYEAADAEEVMAGAAIETTEITNLLVNSSFEEALEGNWAAVPTLLKNAVVDTYEMAEAQDGSKVLRVVTYGSGDKGTIDQYLPVDMNARYKLSGYVKTENFTGTEVSLKIDYVDATKDSAKESSTSQKLSNPGSTDGWVKLEVADIDIPDGTEYVRARINVIAGANGGSGTVYIDNLVLTKEVVQEEPPVDEEEPPVDEEEPPVQDTDNLLLNPGFENDLTDWIGVISTANISADSTEKYQGDKSLKIAIDELSGAKRATYMQKYTDFKVGDKFKLSGYLKSETEGNNTIGEVSIQVYCRGNGDANLIHVQNQQIKIGTMDWTKIETPEVEVPEGTNNVEVRFTVQIGKGTVWLDNFSLTKLVEVGGAGELDSITVTPGKTTLNVEETTTLDVKGLDSKGNAVDLSEADITYTSSAPYILSVSEDGTVTAESKGSARVTVKVSLNDETAQKNIDFTVEGENEVVKYDFLKAVTSKIADGANWEVNSTDVTITNGVRSQYYGIQVQSFLGQYITFNIAVPEEGIYTTFFKGFGAGGGGIADIYVDDMFIGQYNFFSAAAAAKAQKMFKTLKLDAGIHTLTFKAVGRPNEPGAWGENMYLTELALVPKSTLPVLATVEATADKTNIAVGQTAKVTAKGIMGNGYVDLLRNDDAVVEYISTAADVASVDENGNIKALKPGQTNISVKVTINGVTKESAVIPFTVNDKVLTTVELQLEKDEIPVGITTSSTVTAKFGDGSIIGLKDAKVVFSSSDEEIATVDENGVVTAVSDGMATISAEVTLGNTTVKGEAQLSVVPVKLETITVECDKDKLFIGRQATLTITGKMNDTTDADLSKAVISYKMYSVVDEDAVEDNTLAEVNGENGVAKVTALKSGTLKIVVEVTLDEVTLTGEDIVITIESTEGIQSSKTKPTYYTVERVAAARENIEKYDWAKALKDTAVELADNYVDNAEQLWNMVSPQSIPRSMTVNPQYICPSCQADLRAKFGNYPWLSDPLNSPWKLECPNCHVKFPTNDFEAYYKGGLNENGVFDPVLAKQHNDELIAKGEKGNLVNILYPEKGENWGVDNGYGWIDASKVRHTFIGYYTHWGVWYGGTIQKALDALRDAYIYTGDVKYARTGIILLDRIADVYPDMDLAAYKDADGYRNSHGGTGEGKIIGSIWETNLVQSFIKAYDAFFPAMDDEETKTFLQNKSTEYDLDNPKNTVALIRKNIEDGILRQVYPAVKDAQIRGNFGMHQAALALAAVVLDTNPETKEWLDFNFQAGTLVSNPWRVTGGDIMATLVDKVDRDGHGNEAAPGYNKLWLDQILEVANVLDGYEGYPGADLYKNPKFMKMFSAFYPLILAERYTAQIGDSGSTGNIGLHISMGSSVTGFVKFGDPVLAQLAYFLNNNSVDGLHGDIFMKDPESVGPKIQEVIDEHGKLDLGSDNLTGYGFAVLRDGINSRQYFGIQIPFADLTAFDATTGFRYFENSGTIQFEADKADHKISFKFNVPKTDVYEVDLNPFKAVSYGIYDVRIDGKKVKTVDFYGGSGADSNLEVLATMELTEGEHVITFEGVGMNEASIGYKMGVIHLILFDEESLEVKNDTTLQDTQRDIWVYYGRNTGHGHKDTLNLGVHAYGLDVAPDLGYPEQTGDQPNRIEWVSNTVSHNTVVVNKSKQKDIHVGTPKHFDDSDMVDVIDVDAKAAYDATNTADGAYRRTVAMIKVNDEISYSVDFFRVKGGSDHHYSFHGYEGSVTTEGLNLKAQKDEEGNFVGTYAGVDTQFGVRPDNDSVSGWNYSGPGFHWLKNVEKDTAPANKFSIDWDIVDGRKVLPEEMDIHLRLTMLGEYDDVAIMDGIPPKTPGNPASLKYMIAHRNGQNLSSTFTAVIEPYKDERYIASIDEVPVTVNGEATTDDVKAVKVVLTNGRTDYIVNALDNETVYTVDGKFQFKGFLGVYSEIDGKQVYGYINDGTIIGSYTYEAPAAKGTVKSFTKDMNVNNELTVELADADAVNADSLIGRYIYVANDGEQNAVYKIKGIKAVNGNEVTFDLGASTLIRKFVDSTDISKGYIYNIAEGNDFVIPLSNEETKMDATLEYIKLGSNLISGFAPEKLKYTVKLPYGITAIPAVTAAANSEAAVVEITQADGIPGKATIKVTAEDGVTVRVYEVNFVYNATKDQFTVGELKITDLDGNEITELTAGSDIKASVQIANNTERVAPATVILALYDENDKIVNYAIASQQVGSNSEVTIEAGFRLPAKVEGYKVKAFVWDNWEGMKPLSNAVEFPQK